MQNGCEASALPVGCLSSSDFRSGHTCEALPVEVRQDHRNETDLLQGTHSSHPSRLHKTGRLQNLGFAWHQLWFPCPRATHIEGRERISWNAASARISGSECGYG